VNSQILYIIPPILKEKIMGSGELVSFGAITNTTLPYGAYALIEVADDGCGMSSETLSKIFDPFFTTKFTGRGLGLSAVLGIIQGQKGGIIVESSEGAGTRFRILLPVIVSPVAECRVRPSLLTKRRRKVEKI
jgi:two-component system, cell cycle sensor histidine kinase and response regulator CckA